jgi:NhaC family Na+:H+ antiporter
MINERIRGMDIASALIFIFFSLIFSVYNNINIVYPLFVGLLLLMLVAVRRGFKLQEVIQMALKGGRKSLLIIRIFILIGAITAVWRASGTVAFIVYHGIELMNPRYFIVYAFILSSIISFLLGTAFGTVGTIGIVMMILAKSGNVDINIAAGAIIAGAYFGDRCSPMSSSAVLTASITETDLYRNIKNMFKTAMVPFILSIIAYIILSVYNPLVFTDRNILHTISGAFNIHIAAILPAAAILILAAFKVDVKISMLVSIVIGMLLAFLLQGYSIPNILKYAAVGFTLDGTGVFNDIIKGGGILSMLKIGLIVLISSAYSGIFEGTQMLKEIKRVLEIIADRYGIFVATTISGLITASLGCTQALAILLTNQLIKDAYKKQNRDKYELAVDIENSAVIISPLIPWNIAGAVPAAALTATIGFLPFAFYLYLIPICNLIAKMLKRPIQHK